MDIRLEKSIGYEEFFFIHWILKMCALNMWLFDCDAVVDWGDTLAGTTWMRWEIRKGGFIREYEVKEEKRQGPEQGALPWAA